MPGKKDKATLVQGLYMHTNQWLSYLTGAEKERILCGSGISLFEPGAAECTKCGCACEDCSCTVLKAKERIWGEYLNTYIDQWIRAEYHLYKKVLGDTLAHCLHVGIRGRNPCPP